MSRNPVPTARRSSGSVSAFLCNLIGTLMLLTVILSSLPLAVPRLLGYEVYGVVSGSMEPTIPTGSVIYVETVEPVAIEKGDIIAFGKDGDVVAHRVSENRFVEGKFITKGDANALQDFESVPYSSLIGRVARSLPYVGRYMMLYASSVGKAYALCFAGCGVLFNILAGRMRERQRERLRRRLEAEIRGE